MASQPSFQIESGVPLPNDSGIGAPRKYPFPSMQIGDSFLVATEKAANARAAAKMFARRQGVQFTVRKLDSGTRIWRVA